MSCCLCIGIYPLIHEAQLVLLSTAGCSTSTKVQQIFSISPLSIQPLPFVMEQFAGLSTGVSYCIIHWVKVNQQCLNQSVSMRLVTCRTVGVIGFCHVWICLPADTIKMLHYFRGFVTGLMLILTWLLQLHNKLSNLLMD